MSRNTHLAIPDVQTAGATSIDNAKVNKRFVKEGVQIKFYPKKKPTKFCQFLIDKYFDGVSLFQTDYNYRLFICFRNIN